MYQYTEKRSANAARRADDDRLGPALLHAIVCLATSMTTAGSSALRIHGDKPAEDPSATNLSNVSLSPCVVPSGAMTFRGPLRESAVFQHQFDSSGATVGMQQGPPTNCSESNAQVTPATTGSGANFTAIVSDLQGLIAEIDSTWKNIPTKSMVDLRVRERNELIEEIDAIVNEMLGNCAAMCPPRTSTRSTAAADVSVLGKEASPIRTAPSQGVRSGGDAHRREDVASVPKPTATRAPTPAPRKIGSVNRNGGGEAVPANAGLVATLDGKPAVPRKPEGLLASVSKNAVSLVGKKATVIESRKPDTVECADDKTPTVREDKQANNMKENEQATTVKENEQATTMQHSKEATARLPFEGNSLYDLHRGKKDVNYHSVKISCAHLLTQSEREVVDEKEVRKEITPNILLEYEAALEVVFREVKKLSKSERERLMGRGSLLGKLYDAYVKDSRFKTFKKKLEKSHLRKTYQKMMKPLRDPAQCNSPNHGKYLEYCGFKNEDEYEHLYRNIVLPVLRSIRDIYIWSTRNSTNVRLYGNAVMPELIIAPRVLKQTAILENGDFIH